MKEQIPISAMLLAFCSIMLSSIQAQSDRIQIEFALYFASEPSNDPLVEFEKLEAERF